MARRGEARQRNAKHSAAANSNAEQSNASQEQRPSGHDGAEQYEAKRSYTKRPIALKQHRAKRSTAEHIRATRRTAEQR